MIFVKDVGTHFLLKNWDQRSQYSIALVVIVDALTVPVFLKTVRTNVLIITHHTVVGLHKGIIFACWAGVWELICQVVFWTNPCSSSLAHNFFVANHIACDQDVFFIQIQPVFVCFKRRKLQQLCLHLIVCFCVFIPTCFVYDHVHLVIDDNVLYVISVLN